MFPGPSLGMSMLGCLAAGMPLPIRWQVHCTATLCVLLRVWVVLASYYRSGGLASDAAGFDLAIGGGYGVFDW